MNQPPPPPPEDIDPAFHEEPGQVERIIGWVRAAAREGGIWLALIIAVTAIVLVVVVGPEAGVDVTPTSDDRTIDVIASTGEQGFKVAEFCADPATKVSEFAAPDASGLTYQLVRVRDSVTESVVVITGPTGDNPAATHYYDAGGNQQSQPAVVDKKARDCIEGKAR